MREKCCCPTFLIAAGGPWLSVLGSVLTDKFIIQRLTDMRWMALSSTEEDNQVYHNARVLIALRECLKKSFRNFIRPSSRSLLLSFPTNRIPATSHTPLHSPLEMVLRLVFST
jgi:hypothetical protein